MNENLSDELSSEEQEYQINSNQPNTSSEDISDEKSINFQCDWSPSKSRAVVKGPKGKMSLRIPRKKCNIQEKLYSSIVSKIGDEETAESVIRLITETNKNKNMENQARIDGVILNLIEVNNLSTRELKMFFKIGQNRIDRIKADRLKKKTGGLNGR